jgi:hypothetical protein
VHAGQVAVEHDHVVVVDAEALQRGVAVERDVHGVGVVAQPLGDRLGEHPLVFDH